MLACLSISTKFVRHGIRASVESYSIKHLEPFYGFKRDTQLPDANAAMANLQANLELGDVPSITEATKSVVRPITKMTAFPPQGCGTGWKHCAIN